MPLIPFPNVPNVKGVPALMRAASATGSIVTIAKSFGLIKDKTAEWRILSADGKTAIKPDSVISFEYRGESKISTYPVENGSFASYNKVRMPADARLTMTCGGNVSSVLGSIISGSTDKTKEYFLSKLEEMKNSTDSFSIVTPDAEYKNMNLVGYDYSRRSTNGVTLLTVDASFMEVRVSALVQYSSTAKPSGSNPVSNGSVDPAAASTAQYDALLASGGAR